MVSTSSHWNDSKLDEMRQVGDPPADAVIKEIFEGGISRFLSPGHRLANLNQHFMMRSLVNSDPLPSALSARVREFLESVAVEPLPDPEIVSKAQNLFVDHGPEILATLGCYALPTAYAARKGVKVLYQTAYLNRRPARRMSRTMQMVIDVMEPGGLGPDGHGIRTVQKVRLMHAALRYEILKEGTWDISNGVPINQEDLAGTLLTFSCLAVEGLRKLGAKVPDEKAEAYLETWCAIGRLLGLVPELIPPNLAAGAELRDLISRRQLAPSDEGRAMTRALIAALENNSPPLMQGVPTGLMRFFMSPDIADFLEIPEGRLHEIVADVAVAYAKHVDQTLDQFHWYAMTYRHYMLSFIETLARAEGGTERDFFRIPAHLHRRWRGANPESEESIWGHLADWILSRV